MRLRHISARNLASHYNHPAYLGPWAEAIYAAAKGGKPTQLGVTTLDFQGVSRHLLRTMVRRGKISPAECEQITFPLVVPSA